MKILVLVLMAASLLAQTPAPRPRTEGAAHMAYYVTDMTKALSYYQDFLGFDEAFVLKNPDGSDHISFIKINDRQFIELFVEPHANHESFHDVGVWTSDAAGARAAFASLGVKVPPAVTRNQAGDLSFDVIDPFGFDIQVVQYLPDSRTGIGKGKHMPADRVSAQIDHLGILLNDREAGARFYSRVFGFTTEGDGSTLRMGDGPDRFELGFEGKPPAIDRFHGKGHICLSVPDVMKVAAMLQANPAAKAYREIETQVRGNGKHIAELYDPDGNRVELIEPLKGN